MSALPRGKPCEGCGAWLIFKRDENGDLKAYERSTGREHRPCKQYEEVMRFTNDSQIIDSLKTLVALANKSLRRYRVDIKITSLEALPT